MCMTSDKLLIKRAKFAGILFLNHKHWQYGAHAFFRPLTKHWGMKFFTTAFHRNHTFDVHTKLAKHGLSPRVKCKFQFKARVIDDTNQFIDKVSSRRTFYGYLMKVVNIPGSDHVDHYHAKLSALIRHVKDLMPTIDWSDICGVNVGACGNQLLIIDVSCCLPRNDFSAGSIRSINFSALSSSYDYGFIPRLQSMVEDSQEAFKYIY